MIQNLINSGTSLSTLSTTYTHLVAGENQENQIKREKTKLKRHGKHYHPISKMKQKEMIDYSKLKWQYWLSFLPDVFKMWQAFSWSCFSVIDYALHLLYIWGG